MASALFPRALCVVACLAATALPILAQEQRSGQNPAAQNQNATSQDLVAVPNRPTFATTAESVQRGVFEIEYGVEAASGHQNVNGLLKWGVFANLELRFANNPIIRDSGVAGTGDSGAGFKLKAVRQSKHVPTISVLYTAAIPTAPSSRGIGAIGHSVQLLASKDFGKHHFDVNEGVQFVGRRELGGFDRNYFSSLSYSYGFNKRWGATGEIAGFSKTNAKNAATLTLLEAVTYSPSSRLVFDIGGYFSAYGALPRFTFAVGLTYSVADLYRRHR
jgi:hypothetical protein